MRTALFRFRVHPPDHRNVENDPVESRGGATDDLNVATTMFWARGVNRMGSLGN